MNQPPHPKSRQRGFTLLELVVTLATIGVLVSLLVPSVQQARESARWTVCRNRLKQLSLALLHFESSEGAFPPGHDGPSHDATDANDGGDSNTWIGHLYFVLPYLEGTSLQTALKLPSDLKSPWFTSIARESGPLRSPSLSCPSQPQAPVSRTIASIHNSAVQFLYTPPQLPTNFLGSSGLPRRASPSTGVFYSRDGTKIRDITDGTTNTLLIGETLGHSTYRDPRSPIARHSVLCGGIYTEAIGDQTEDYDIGPAHAIRFRSTHPGGVNFGLVDGSVRTVSHSIDTAVYANLGSISDGDWKTEF